MLYITIIHPMKKYPIFRVVLAVLMLPLTASAASFVVWPGQSLQAAIDAAAAGDNITVQTGSYNENITITKGIDVRGVGGAVLVTGTLTVTEPALPVYLADISFGKSGASSMTLTGDGTQKVRMDRCKLVGGGDLNCNGMIAYFYKHQFDRNVDFTSSTWTFQRSSVAGSLTSTDCTAKFIASSADNFAHRGDSAGELTLFQSSVWQFTDVTLPESVQGWIAYSTLRRVELSGGVIEVVGNHFNGRDTQHNLLTLNDQCQSLIRNNLFWDDDSYRDAIWVGSSAGSTRIFNNTIRDVYRGIYIQGSPTAVEIRGNIHAEHSRGGQPSVRSDFSGTIIADNNFQYGIVGGVQSGNINEDPFFRTGPDGQQWWLAPTSPSRNAGPENVIFNNIDGSRNDQGAYGGHSYDPTGRTTLKPVVLSGAVSPLYVKRGGAVTIKARAAVVAPE